MSTDEKNTLARRISPTWIPFHYDSNSAFGLIDSPDAWTRLLANIKGGAEIALEARSATWLHANTALEAGGAPSFGYRREHVGGKESLREWATTCGMIEWLHVPPTTGVPHAPTT